MKQADTDEAILDRICAKAVFRTLWMAPSHIDRRDMYQVAAIAVLESRARWDPERAPFEAFAYRRAYGAIMDYLRQEQFGPRGAPYKHPRYLSEVVHKHHGSDSASVTLADTIQDDTAGISEPHDHRLFKAIEMLIDEHLSSEEAWTLRMIARGLPANRVAQMTGVTGGAVSHRMKKVRSKLRPFVEDLLGPYVIEPNSEKPKPEVELPVIEKRPEIDLELMVHIESACVELLQAIDAAPEGAQKFLLDALSSARCAQAALRGDL